MRGMRTVEDFTYAHHARATRRVYDTDGTYAPRGSIGTICDYLFHDGDNGYLVVDFPETGPMLCEPQEVRPA